MNMDNIRIQLYHLLTKGALSKGGTWGGDECSKHTSLSMHIIESSIWIASLIIMWFVFHIGKHIKLLHNIATKKLTEMKITRFEHFIDQSFAMLHFSMYLQLIYYKFNISSLINLIQPCHLVLLIEGIALYTDEALSVQIAVLLLPTLSGTFFATIFPDTGGLDQPFEILAYWIQHILILIVPIYLLLRKGCLGLKLFSFKYILIGLWILAVAHWSLYEIVDVSLKVNVEFMLCPTNAMTYIFAQAPKEIVNTPTYRSLMTYIVIIVGITISYVYYFISLLISNLLNIQDSQTKKIN